MIKLQSQKVTREHRSNRKQAKNKKQVLKKNHNILRILNKDVIGEVIGNEFQKQKQGL